MWTEHEECKVGPSEVSNKLIMLRSSGKHDTLTSNKMHITSFDKHLLQKYFIFRSIAMTWMHTGHKNSPLTGHKQLCIYKANTWRLVSTRHFMTIEQQKYTESWNPVLSNVLVQSYFSVPEELTLAVKNWYLLIKFSPDQSDSSLSGDFAYFTTAHIVTSGAKVVTSQMCTWARIELSTNVTIRFVLNILF